MRAYGVKRDYNEVEDVIRNGRASRHKTHAKVCRIYRRAERRRAKMRARLMIDE